MMRFMSPDMNVPPCPRKLSPDMNVHPSANNDISLSNHVKLVVPPRRRFGTSRADAVDFKAMTAHSKSMISGDAD